MSNIETLLGLKLRRDWKALMSSVSVLAIVASTEFREWRSCCL